MHRFLSLMVLAFASTTLFAQSPSPPIPPDLENYIKKPEPDYKWSFKKKDETEAGTVYLYSLTSQKWHDEIWEHDLQVFMPKEATDKSSMVILNTGGAAGGGTSALGLEVARRVKFPVAILFQIPKQPLYDGKKEDALIAETFVRFLETKDSTWPLLFPMAKSVIKSMDALQEIGKKDWNVEVKNFIITGASKRGWTSWLSAATGDKRIKAIAPMVIDTLNFQKQMPHQLKSFGKYSEQIHDYEERKLLPLPDSDDARRLWAMVDPWVYREKLTLPKLLIHGTNDPYWAQDATNQYWDDLKGDKWVLYVPNAGHDLRPQDKPNQPGAKKDVFPMKAIDTLGAYCRCILSDKPMPKVTWTSGNGTLTVRPEGGITAVRKWTAESETRDFRKATWKQQVLRSGGLPKGETEIKVGLETPETGFRAYFAEIEAKIDGSTANLSTTIQIVEAKK